MRAYAFKHDGVRRPIASEEERQAYRRGLSRVAGHRLLAHPWKREE